MGDLRTDMLDQRANQGHFGFAFNDVDFSDRVLCIEITADSLDSTSDHDKGDPAPNRKRRRENLEKENGVESVNSGDSGSSIVVEVKTYHISSPILAAKSPFFYKLFKNGMRESQQKSATLRISASEEATLMDLMKFMYSNTVSATTTSDLLGVLMVADKFEVTSCMSHCIQLLLNKPISLDSALLYLELPLSVQQLIDRATEYLVVLFKDFNKLSQEKAMDLPLSALEIVLSSVGLQVESEDVVFDFILKWARRHYPKLEERRDILTKWLVSFMCFLHMNCWKLKEVLVCPDVHSEKVSSLVFEALVYKAENSYGHHIQHHSKNPTTHNSKFFNREYKHRLIKVVQLETPRPHCFVFFDLNKGDCVNLVQSRKLYSEGFRLGGRRFYLYAEYHKNQRTSSYHFGLYVQMAKESETCTLDCEFSVMKKRSEHFESKYNVIDLPLARDKVVGKRDLFGIPWKTFMADNSEYFVNGILHLRAELIIKNSHH